MAESDKAKSLSEDYLLKEVEEKLKVDSEPEEKSVEKDVAPVESPVESPVEPAVAETVPAVSEEVAPEENVSGPPPVADEDATESPPAADEDATEKADEATTETETETETPEIKLETAPGDYRFPTTNQSRHCFTRYVEYHRCVAAKGEDASECDKFAKYYRSLCPGEWVDRWNEQRENGTFPGPL